MTKEEWLSRCAKRYVEKAGMTQSQADDFANACFDAQEVSYESNFCKYSIYNPESCADEDMAEWNRDT